MLHLQSTAFGKCRQNATRDLLQPLGKVLLTASAALGDTQGLRVESDAQPARRLFSCSERR